MKEDLLKILDSIYELEEQLHTVEEVCRLMSHDRLADKVLDMHMQVSSIYTVAKRLFDQNLALSPTEAP
jgi:hypothetical protein